MNRAIGSAGIPLAGVLPAGSVLAHTGHQAHVHPGQGFIDAVAHWLAGVMLWPGALAVLVGVAGLAAALVWSRRRRLATARRG